MASPAAAAGEPPTGRPSKGTPEPKSPSGVGPSPGIAFLDDPGLERLRKRRKRRRKVSSRENHRTRVIPN